MGSDEEQKIIDEVIAKFPATFGLRNHEGTFRISRHNSYFRGPGEAQGELMLYTQRLRIVTPTITRSEYDPTQEPREEWVDFAKGTEDELRRNVRW